jgi:ABC-2 type transport system ATP-binding protein
MYWKERSSACSVLMEPVNQPHLEIIETLRIKTSGEVTVDGFNLDDSPNEIKKIIGVQLQTSGYYPGLTLVELIALFAGLYNEVVDPLALLDTVNLRDKAKAKFKELSGGQKQRFSIATTLSINPRSFSWMNRPRDWIRRQEETCGN